ncbi:MAG TPA: PhzF family phenazine biosynthesis protein [Solirubrobacteraceae bacterium]|nr:PhzF family phenazine biosynthesis protein [Solirubrobacteraceae bacterium]
MADLAARLEYRHVDVFSEVPFAGNGLIVAFGEPRNLPTEALISLTVEMRQFELIVVDVKPRAGRVSARIFTAQEELPFAGHPVIGAAAALHERDAIEPSRSWVFVIEGREIAVRSERTERYYTAEMNQGSAVLGSPLGHADAARFARALDLSDSELHSLPMQVVSTGLPYLIVPVSCGLERARIVVEDFGARLASVGAKFVYMLDPEEREGRTWDNTGAVEDVATGSAAGPVAAYLAAHGLATEHESIILHQGRFLARPSRISVKPDSRGELWVGGPVAPVAFGVIDGSPDAAASPFTVRARPAVVRDEGVS